MPLSAIPPTQTQARYSQVLSSSLPLVGALPVCQGQGQIRNKALQRTSQGSWTIRRWQPCVPPCFVASSTRGRVCLLDHSPTSGFLPQQHSLAGPRLAWRGRGVRRDPPPCTSSRSTLWCSMSLSLLPRPLTYSTRLADAEPAQISELWQHTLGCHRDPQAVSLALRHSFSVVVAIDESWHTADGSSGTIVGVGRAVSDGAFVATICDVAVLPEYQRRGIGRRVVKELVKDMRRKGPSGFAVFPPPSSRRFFWHLGFRQDKKYRLMAYNGRYLGTCRDDVESCGPALSHKLGPMLRRMYKRQSLFRHGELQAEDEEQQQWSGEQGEGEEKREKLVCDAEEGDMDSEATGDDAELMTLPSFSALPASRPGMFSQRTSTL